jgi:hypothetical protein
MDMTVGFLVESLLTHYRIQKHFKKFVTGKRQGWLDLRCAV